MSNPVLVEVVRGPLVESRHRGAVAVLDAEGRTVLSVGDVAAPVFPRSAIKALQALPLVESGAAERYGFGDEALALACASHSGEPAHVAGVEQMLARAGLSPSALRCGVHWPMAQTAAAAVARAGGPSALHNNCSGKHAGFLCLACAMGAGTDDYFRPDHPVQSGSARGDRGFHRRRARTTGLRHRRLLGADLGGAARPAGAGFCQIRHRSWPVAGTRPRRGAAARGLRCENRGSSPAPDGSAPRSCSISAAAFSSRPAPKASIAARCRSKGSASPSNATTAPAAPRRRSWRNDDRALPAARCRRACRARAVRPSGLAQLERI